MPIIIDANRSGDFTTGASHAPEILARIARGQLSVVLGGRLLRELFATKLKGLLVEWIRAGRAHRIDDATVNTEEVRIRAMAICSDDPHVLALATMSGCRLLYTLDDNLIKDFKNITVISPKGKVVKPTTKRKVACALFDNSRG